jgi:preprotein translocase subunit SecG
MYTFFVVLHVFVSIMLIMVVLLQTGKGAGMGAAFGGGTQTLFGGRGPTTFIHKLTTGMAVLFLVLSITLASLSSRSQSALEEDMPPPTKEAGLMAPAEEAKEETKEETKPAEAKPAEEAKPTEKAKAE